MLQNYRNAESPIKPGFCVFRAGEKKFRIREKIGDANPYCKKYNKQKSASPGNNVLKNSRVKRDKKRVKKHWLINYVWINSYLL